MFPFPLPVPFHSRVGDVELLCRAVRDAVEEITRTSKAQVGVPSDLLLHFAVNNVSPSPLAGCGGTNTSF